MPVTSDHVRALNDLRNQDILALVTHFVRSCASQPLIGAVVSLLDKISADLADFQRLIDQLIFTLTDTQFQEGLLHAIEAHVKAHPWQTAFFIIGIVLMCNPLAMVGFGSLGPVAGSLAAAWQSTMGGTVAAGSAFSILQSWGMMYSVVIPVAGTLIAAGSAAAGNARDTWVVLNAGGREVERWSKGEYGKPVSEWWNGEYGDFMTRWWKGEHGSPVSDWARAAIKKD